VEGIVYVLPKEFLINLSDAHFAKLSVALVLPTDAAPAAGAEGATPPEGYGALEQEGAVRAVITDTITDASKNDLVNRKRRAKLRAKVLKSIKAHTDVKANDVLFTDVAVQ
jgi:flagellar FliL protein